MDNSNPRFFPGALAIGGGGLIIVGSFLPWITATLPLIGTISRNGVDGGGDGVISLGLGIVVAVLGLAFLSASGLKRPDVLVGIGGGLALVGDLRGRRGRDTRCDRLRTDVARRTHPAAASGAADITASDAELGG